MINKKLGPYTITEGMATVYRAYQPSPARALAVANAKQIELHSRVHMAEIHEDATEDRDSCGLRAWGGHWTWIRC